MLAYVFVVMAPVLLARGRIARCPHCLPLNLIWKKDEVKRREHV